MTFWLKNMTIKLLDGSKCEDFYGGWFSFMKKYVGKEISKRQDWANEWGEAKYAEGDSYFQVWLEDGCHYLWDKRCVEIMEDDKK